MHGSEKKSNHRQNIFLTLIAKLSGFRHLLGSFSENMSIGKCICRKICPPENLTVGKCSCRKIFRRKICVGKFAVGNIVLENLFSENHWIPIYSEKLQTEGPSCKYIYIYELQNLYTTFTNIYELYNLYGTFCTFLVFSLKMFPLLVKIINVINSRCMIAF